MKPAAFNYRRPVSINDTVSLLSTYGSDSKILAGGQTLVPMLNFRLAAPSVLIDVNEVDGLNQITQRSDGLELGALVRWHQMETDSTIAAANPLLVEAVKHIAHYQIRNRGTWAGSSAHADPAAEFPAIAVACGARFGIQSVRGRRTIEAGDFFLGPLTTALKDDELLTDVFFPKWPIGRRWAFEEFALRQGDFAIAGIVVIIDRLDGAIACRLTCFGAGDRPARLFDAESIVASEGTDACAIAKAADAASREVDAQSDIHASAAYRRALVGILVQQTLVAAIGSEERE